MFDPKDSQSPFYLPFTESFSDIFLEFDNKNEEIESES